MNYVEDAIRASNAHGGTTGDEVEKGVGWHCTTTGVGLLGTRLETEVGLLASEAV